MIRGTTPTHIFTLPLETYLIDELKISYAQSHKEILSKSKNDCILEGNTIKVKLTQEETFLFDCEKNAQVQLRVKTIEGDVFGSAVSTFKIECSLSEEVL